MNKHEFGTPYTDEEIEAIWAKAEADARATHERMMRRTLQAQMRDLKEAVASASGWRVIRPHLERTVGWISKRIEALEERK